MAVDVEFIFSAVPFDPCAAYEALYPSYMAARIGKDPQKIMFRDREVWFFKADITEWTAVMNDLLRECRAKKGLPSGRMAITGGYRYSR